MRAELADKGSNNKFLQTQQWPFICDQSEDFDQLSNCQLPNNYIPWRSFKKEGRQTSKPILQNIHYKSVLRQSHTMYKNKREKHELNVLQLSCSALHTFRHNVIIIIPLVCWLGKIHKLKQNISLVQSPFTHHIPNIQVDRCDISQPKYFTKTHSYGCPKFPVVLGVTEFHLQAVTQAPRLNFRQATKAPNWTRYL
jgi:hypothetical protein